MGQSRLSCDSGALWRNPGVHSGHQRQPILCVHLQPREAARPLGRGPWDNEGDARSMARDVQNTFYEIVAEFGSMTQPQAVDYVKKLMTKGRYSLDVWS
ncbi:kynureninase [Platysternon megacephalum]|uniref:Kynureninase n=1 Tax=Platysternon megacephalum TaxID=55544 RepID=A0A4D9DD45_9SAUR|nr:kynureninase [Platysternon megacephalum]